MSVEHPNLQQQPARDDFSAKWRSIYLPDEGGLWASADYSQQEPRLVAHFASIAGCAKADRAVARYRSDPNTDNHQMMADLTGLPRKQAKNIFLGLCYGMGGARLAESLGLPVANAIIKGKQVEQAGEEAQEILDRFDEMAPFVRQLYNKARDVGYSRGYIRTLLGRRCRFPVNPFGRGHDFSQNAMNRLIQGSAADQTKLAMVNAAKAGFKLQLQVHDELDLTVASKDEALKLAHIMETAVELKVPCRVDVEVGASWGEAE